MAEEEREHRQLKAEECEQVEAEEEHESSRRTSMAKEEHKSWGSMNTGSSRPRIGSNVRPRRNTIAQGHLHGRGGARELEEHENSKGSSSVLSYSNNNNNNRISNNASNRKNSNNNSNSYWQHQKPKQKQQRQQHQQLQQQQ